MASTSPREVVITTRTVSRAVRKRVPLTGHGEGFTTVPDGSETATIEFVVDIAEIARLYGAQVLSNKSGHCNLLYGAVRLTVITRAHTSEPGSK